jgi:hypothetical protein
VHAHASASLYAAGFAFTLSSSLTAASKRTTASLKALNMASPFDRPEAGRLLSHVAHCPVSDVAGARRPDDARDAAVVATRELDELPALLGVDESPDVRSCNLLAHSCASYVNGTSANDYIKLVYCARSAVRSATMATFPRGSGDKRLWAKNRRLIDGLSGNEDREPERGRWVVDPADVLTLRGIPAVGSGGAPSAVRGSSPHRDAPSLRR